MLPFILTLDHVSSSQKNLTSWEDSLCNQNLPLANEWIISRKSVVMNIHPFTYIYVTGTVLNSGDPVVSRTQPLLSVYSRLPVYWRRQYKWAIMIHCSQSTTQRSSCELFFFLKAWEIWHTCVRVLECKQCWWGHRKEQTERVGRGCSGGKNGA